MATIGVSIEVPEPWGRHLQDYRVALGDTAAVQIPTHVTLLPPHEATTAEVDDSSTHLDDVARRQAPFDLLLRGTGTFRPVSPVVFVNVVAGISRCEVLCDEVQDGPVQVETRFPYHPHVTIAQDLPEDVLDRAFDELAGFEAGFRVEDFHLYRYDQSAGWQQERTFRLIGRA